MASLYNLTGEYKHLEEALMLNPDDEELKKMFDEIDDNIESKADGYARIIKNFAADITAIEDEITRLANRKASLTRHIEKLKENLIFSMKVTGKTKFKTELFSFNVAKNGGSLPLVLDVEPEKIPDNLCKIKVVREADKDALKKYIDETGDLSYGHYGERGESLRIR